MTRSDTPSGGPFDDPSRDTIFRLRPRQGEAIKPEKFKRGQVVQLRSGGEPMTVSRVLKGEVNGDWHDNSGSPIQATYHSEMLAICPIIEDAEKVDEEEESSPA